MTISLFEEAAKYQESALLSSLPQLHEGRRCLEACCQKSRSPWAFEWPLVPCQAQPTGTHLTVAREDEVHQESFLEEVEPGHPAASIAGDAKEGEVVVLQLVACTSSQLPVVLQGG